MAAITGVQLPFHLLTGPQSELLEHSGVFTLQEIQLFREYLSGVLSAPSLLQTTWIRYKIRFDGRFLCDDFPYGSFALN